MAFSFRHYLERKQVKPYNLKLYKDNVLVVPIYDESKSLVNIQMIQPNGEKRFLNGGKKKGCFAVIGPRGGVIQICEGWATGASLHQETGHFTVVALDAGNLETVAIVIRKLYPESKIIICGDNDESRTGQKAARSAALAVNGKYIIPVTVGNDWNDELTMEGC